MTAAAGLLLRAPDARRRPLVLLQRRAPGTRDGERWEMAVGARRCGETSVQAALREAVERAAVDPDRVRIRGELATESFTAVVADVAEPPAAWPKPAGLAWVPETQIAGLNLHPAFAAGWPALRVQRIGLVVDAANVIGSRPDGWWKDRAGAAQRFLREVAAAGPGVFPLPRGGFCDDGRTRKRFFGWVDSPVLVLEGTAARAADVPGVEVVRAPGTADDAIVDLVTAARTWLVVTADRPLRSRLPAHAHPISPTTFLSWVGP